MKKINVTLVKFLIRKRINEDIMRDKKHAKISKNNLN